jgi:type VI secretion system secreted protein Hcp
MMREMRRIFSVIAAALGLVLLPTEASAENVFLFLKSDGAEVHGDSSARSLGRGAAIECVVFEQTVDQNDQAARDLDGRTNPPIKCLKRVDQSSPVLAGALVRHATIDATFRFYRRRANDWRLEHFYEIHIADAKISSIHMIKADKAQAVPMEEISFTFAKIGWTFFRDGAPVMTNGTPPELEPAHEL